MAVNRQPGGLRIATDIEGRGRIGDVPASGLAEAAGRAASALSAQAGRIGEMADKAALVEGAEAGKIAGVDPEFRPMKTGTIYGDAYDRAGLQVAETRTRQAMLADLDAVFDRHAQSPGDLKVALDDKRAKWLGGAIPDLRPDLALSFDGAALTLHRKATRNHLAALAAEQQAALQTELSLGLKSLHQKAFALGLDATADEALAAEMGRLAGVMRRVDPTGKPLVEPKAAAKILHAATEEMTTARVLGAFERLPGEAAKRTFIDEFEADFAASRGAAKIYDLQGFEAVRGQLRSALRRVATEGAATARAALGGIRSVADRAQKGFAAPPEEMAALEAEVAAAGDPELGAALARAKDVLAFQGAIRSMAPAELDATVREMRAVAARDGASDALAARIAMADGVLDTMRSEIKQDPLGWAERTGRVGAVAALDLSSGETAAATLRARIAQADTIAQAYGIAPQYLRPDERRRLAVAASEGGEATLQVATAIAGAAGVAAPGVLAEIFEEAPVAGMIGGLTAAVGLSPAARDAADGLALRKTEGFKARAPSPQKARTLASSVLKTALSELPRSELAAIETANAIYEVRALRRGLADLDEALWTGSLAEALGARVVGGVQYGGLATVGGGWWGGGTTVLVPPDVRTDGLPKLLGALRIEDIPDGARPHLDAGQRASTTDLRRAKLKSAGSGQYFLALGDPEGAAPDWLVDAAGDRFVLDLKALKPVLRRRRPDVYLGGR